MTRPSDAAVIATPPAQPEPVAQVCRCYPDGKEHGRHYRECAYDAEIHRIARLVCGELSEVAEFSAEDMERAHAEGPCKRICWVVIDGMRAAVATVQRSTLVDGYGEPATGGDGDG